jgi:glycosyltransferase involved in cell wall biosynthesis
MSLDWDIVTPHYPPQEGGIADYTFVVAQMLGLAGDSVSVWCPQAPGTTPEAVGVRVHRVFTSFKTSELVGLNRIWKASREEGRRILLMYHPHGFGFHSLNVPFCWWLWRRAAFNRDRVVLVLHEYGIEFKPWRYYLFASVHRLMLALALRGASQVWSPVQAWTQAARSWTLGRAIPIDWLPVFSNIPQARDAAQVIKTRSSLVKEGELLVGHFGTCPRSVTRLLDTLFPALLRSRENCKVLLIGAGTDQYARALEGAHPELRGRIRGLGVTSAASISIHLGACDVLLQPYPAGVNARHTSAMAALANGVPLITTLGHLSEPFWQELAFIRTVPVGDFAEIIPAAEELLDRPDIRKSMSLEAQSYYEQHFAPEQVVSQLRACEIASSRRQVR